MKIRELTQRVTFGCLRIAAIINGVALGLVLYYLLKNGITTACSWTFLTSPPRNMMTEGGIMPCIVGTFILSFGSIIVSLPLGVGSAIYLSEYAPGGKLVRIIRLGINNLAGVPSIVFGLFGLAFFAIYLKLQVSIFSGILTLGFLNLPIIIGTAEEAIRGVPSTYREASLALGASKWQTIWKVVLPSALPGILTGSILSLSRAAGETAAIMYTAAVFFSPHLPHSIFQPVMALPYHIYVLATAGTEIDKTRPIQYATALVLVAMVFAMNLMAIYFRSRTQKRH